jgi:hypothetical protein
MFSLVKWYCDVVNDAGTGAILYSARLRWGLLRASYASIQYFAPATAPVEQATHRRVAMPRLEGDVLRWSNAPLRVEGRWLRDAPAIARLLAQGPDGTVQWCCHMPRARAEVQVGEARLEGLGYAETLHLTVPPWKLGLETLHWGRHLSPAHWVVWIEWLGGYERRWVWLDGQEQPTARLSDGGIRGLSDDRHLVLGSAHDLRDRAVLTTIRGPLPSLARRLSGRLGRLREHKRLASSSIVRQNCPLDYGWTVYEDVTW